MEGDTFVERVGAEEDVSVSVDHVSGGLEVRAGLGGRSVM